MYVRRSTPLHAARAGVAAAYAAALVCAVLAFENPLILAALAVAVVGAGLGAQAGRALARGALFGIPFAVVIALVNPLVTREGLTVILRLGEAPVLGQVDVTSEALAYGGVAGLRALLAILAGGALLATTVDPDEVLRGLRRVSLRSALTAALAVRLVPVLARDARAMSDAGRCRPGAGAQPTAAERVQIVRALATGALDRALDTAATLEVRGYGSHGPRHSAQRRPWSRHDVGFAASAVGLLALAIGARIVDAGSFEAYPRLEVAAGPAEAVLGLALVVVALAPFLDRKGVDRSAGAD